MHLRRYLEDAFMPYLEHKKYVILERDTLVRSLTNILDNVIHFKRLEERPTGNLLQKTLMQTMAPSKRGILQSPMSALSGGSAQVATTTRGASLQGKTSVEAAPTEPQWGENVIKSAQDFLPDKGIQLLLRAHQESIVRCVELSSDPDL